MRGGRAPGVFDERRGDDVPAAPAGAVAARPAVQRDHSAGRRPRPRHRRPTRHPDRQLTMDVRHRPAGGPGPGDQRGRRRHTGRGRGRVHRALRRWQGRNCIGWAVARSVQWGRGRELSHCRPERPRNGWRRLFRRWQRGRDWQEFDVTGRISAEWAGRCGAGRRGRGGRAQRYAGVSRHAHRRCGLWSR